ncbi:MAG: hypothetical protein ACJ8KU_00475 [Chthoniobacterales bacterium]
MRDTTALVAQGYTSLPQQAETPARTAQEALQTSLGEALPRLNPFRQVVAVYLHLAGITTGYGFFAPNVPDNYKLVFELQYPDGHVEYDLPQASSRSGGLRIATLLDNLGQTRYDPLRELIVKAMTYSVWLQHPGVSHVRAVFGFTMLPTPRQFKAGVRESYEFLYAYDLSFDPAGNPEH